MSYSAGKIESAIKKASELRAAGKVVEISLTAQDKSDAEKTKVEKGYKELRWIDE